MKITTSNATQYALIDQYDKLLIESLSIGFALLNAEAGTAMSLGRLGDFDLPPAEFHEIDPAFLSSAAPLYLAAELEHAKIIGSVETLAEAAISGGLPLDLGEAGQFLYKFWQSRNEHFSSEERHAFYGWVFGMSGPTLSNVGNVNTQFLQLLFALAIEIYELDPGLSHVAGADVQLRAAATQLYSNLVSRSGALTSFAARDILKVLQNALDILAHKSIHRALMVRSAWQAAQQIAQRYLGEMPPVILHLQRGRAGMNLLAWLAEIAPMLDSYQRPLIQPNATVREAAFQWLQSSLDLTQAFSISTVS